MTTPNERILTAAARLTVIAEELDKASELLRLAVQTEPPVEPPVEPPAPSCQVSIEAPITAAPGKVITYRLTSNASSEYQTWLVDGSGRWIEGQGIVQDGPPGTYKLTIPANLARGPYRIWYKCTSKGICHGWEGHHPIEITGAVVDPPVEPPGSVDAPKPPTEVRGWLIKPGDRVVVPKHYLGMHVSLNDPGWHNTGSAPIPKPKFPIGVLRNMTFGVDGAEENGFWSSIEVAKGKYDMTRVRTWLAAHPGVPVFWTIYGTPAFYQKYPGERSRWKSWPGIASPPSAEGMAALPRFMAAVKAEMGDRLIGWEVSNEPTLPWDGAARWTPQWGAANGQQDAPFFSGTAEDLAEIAMAMDRARDGVPVYGAGFVDLWRANDQTVERFLNARTSAGTRGKDHIQAFSMHFYDYAKNPYVLKDVIDGYRAKLRAAGVGDLPMLDSETGAEEGGMFAAAYDDPIALQNVGRWLAIGAAKRLEAMILYGHLTLDVTRTQLGNTRSAGMAALLTKAHGIGGRTLTGGAILTDGRVWLASTTGELLF